MCEASKIKIFINNQEVEVPDGITILEAAKKVGIEIPTLCYLKDINHDIGACRICVVKVEGEQDLVSACNTKVREGMKIFTHTPEVIQARKRNLELLLSEHHMDCPLCPRNETCELRKLADTLGVRILDLGKATPQYEIDTSSPSLVRNPNKCVVCQRCITVCKEIQSVGILELVGEGTNQIVMPSGGKPLNETLCVACGQCALVCPTGAITEKEEIDKLFEYLADPEKFVVVQTAPATHVTIGEAFGFEPGEDITGKLVTALKLLGFNRVFDTNWAADLTIIEEGTELIGRIIATLGEKEIKVNLFGETLTVSSEEFKGKPLPQFTSCSPGWINFIEGFFPEFLAHLSTCKSPQQMFGAIAKTYYAKKMNIDPEKMVVVSVMPCTAKKYEAARPEMCDAAKFWDNPNIKRDVDLVVTSREIIKAFRQVGINLRELPDSEYDPLLGASTGAGQIFGATGGVMEAALRTVYEAVTGKTLPKLDFEAVRGYDGIRQAEIEVNGLRVKVAVAHGLKNARTILEKLKAGEAFTDFHFIEIMACPGGCIGGGGQPIGTNTEIRQKRIKGIYERDKKLPLRKSHENPEIIGLYKEFLKVPCGELSHKLLHTHYSPKVK